MLFTIGRSLSLGKVGGLLTLLRNSFGALVITVAIAIGLGTVLESSAVVFTIVKVLGVGSARDWFARSPRRIATLGAIGGVIMIGIGVAVVLVGHGG